MARRKPLTLVEYWHTVGTDNAQQVAALAGTSWDYFKLIAYRQKALGAQLARKLIHAANTVTPGFFPDLALSLQPLDEAQKYEVTPMYGRHRKLMPNRSFERAMRRAA